MSSKNNKSKGRKSPFIIYKTPKGYHVDSRTGKRVSEDIYKSQWSSKGRVSKDAFLKAEKSFALNEKFGEEKISLKYFSNEFAHYERLKKESKRQYDNLKEISDNVTEEDDKGNGSGFANGKLYIQTLFFNLGDIIKEYGKKKNLKIKILAPDKKNFTAYNYEDAKELIVDYVQDINQLNKVSRKKKQGSFMPLIGIVEDLLKKELTIDLKNTFGNNNQVENLNLMQQFFND